MRRAVQKAFVLAVGVVAIMLIAGCQEPNLSNTKSNIRKHQLIATENKQLKKQVEQRDKEIEKQKELLDKCLQEKKVLKEKSDKNIRNQVESILGITMDESAKLRDENKNLKAQVQQLEARVRQLEKELQELKKPGPQPLPSTPEPL